MLATVGALAVGLTATRTGLVPAATVAVALALSAPVVALMSYWRRCVPLLVT